MANKIKCKETKVPKNNEMNDRDYLLDVLETIKNMHVNMATALNEASNEKLYNEFLKITDELSFMQRNLYNLAFQKGWYVLETSKESKVSETQTKLTNKLEELK